MALLTHPKAPQVSVHTGKRKPRPCDRGLWLFGIPSVDQDEDCASEDGEHCSSVCSFHVNLLWLRREELALLPVCLGQFDFEVVLLSEALGNAGCQLEADFHLDDAALAALGGDFNGGSFLHCRDPLVEWREGTVVPSC